MDLLCLIVASTLLSTIWVFAQAPAQAQDVNRVRCTANLKQVGLAFRMWSNDHNELFQMRTPEKKGGSLEAIKSGESFKHFQIMADELHKVNILICPSDNRKVAENFKALKNDNISYFVAPDADEARPQLFLSGDRNITNNLALDGSILELPANKPAGWTESIHNLIGNLGLSDGSVQQTTIVALNQRIAETTDPRNRIQLPESGSGSGEE